MKPSTIFLAYAVFFSFALILVSEARTNANVPVSEVVVSGIVVDPLGQPVSGIKISLTDWFGENWGTAVTDLHGRYEIQGVPPGKYFMRVRALSASGPGEYYPVHVKNHSPRMDIRLNANVSAIARTAKPHAPGFSAWLPCV
jgi:predicted phage tail protein